MTPRSISVLGGGPAGLFAATLLAQDHPEWEVHVFERLPPSDTFGFGVGLTPALLAAVAEEAPAVHDDLMEASTAFSSAAFNLPAGRAELPRSHAGAISRARLLQLLLDRAEEAGVEVEIGASPTVDDLRDDADLVIAADGVSSTTRERFAAELGASEELGRGLFIWCGAPIELEGNVFTPVETEAGLFVSHAYPYAEGLSTFVIETDDRALEAAGCRTADEKFTDDGDSDETSLAYLSKAFEALLGGASFTGNRSRWMSFNTVRCERWHVGNVVLLGDAAATAHPSLGSGTKLALEAAIALRHAMEGLGDTPPAERVPAFEKGRRPAVERLQERARRSQLWWESFGTRLHLSPARIAAAYMSRAGAVSFEQLQASAPDLARQAAADFAGVGPDEPPADHLSDWILHRPLAVNGQALSDRILADGPAEEALRIPVDCGDPWGSDAQALIDRVAAVRHEGDRLVALTGDDSRDALLDRLALGERIRTELHLPVAVSSPKSRLEDAVDGLIAGRADLVEIEGS
jgi:2-polyprenyl-6-methoxyphenol hydroxylase-like FAD-dependent oxidoreductase